MRTHSEMMALPFHPGWEDGRTGYEWCRFDATIDQARFLRAELTWDDNNAPQAANRLYTAPRICIESNTPVMDGGIVWKTLDTIEMLLAEDTAAEILSQPPAALLDRYVAEIATLTFAKEDAMQKTAAQHQTTMSTVIDNFIPVLVQRGPVRVLFHYCEDGRRHAYYDVEDPQDWPLLRLDVEQEGEDGWNTIPGCSLVTLKTPHSVSQELIELGGQILQAWYTFKTKPGLLAKHLRTCPFILNQQPHDPEADELQGYQPEERIKEMPGEELYNAMKEALVKHGVDLRRDPEVDEDLATMAERLATNPALVEA